MELTRRRVYGVELTRRWVYGVQIKLILVGAVSVGKGSLQAINISGEKAMADIFCTHYQIHNQTPRRLCQLPLSLTLGIGETVCRLPVGLEWPCQQLSPSPGLLDPPPHNILIMSPALCCLTHFLSNSRAV